MVSFTRCEDVICAILGRRWRANAKRGVLVSGGRSMQPYAGMDRRKAGSEMEMVNRRDLTLAVLAVANGHSYTPVQLQKSLFLITVNLRSILDCKDKFDFRAYDYGPFDEQVYREAESLEAEGLASISLGWNGRWKEYSATEDGVKSGRIILDRLDKSHKDYIDKISSWVRSQSFGSLVKSIYEAYPDMKTNSIFQY